MKIGSSSLAKRGAFKRLAKDLALAQRDDPRRRFVLVSSGAIALGCHYLGWKRRPRSMAKLQAAAAAGQALLMQNYHAAFKTHGIKIAQVLLTHADVRSRERTNNAREAVAALTREGVLPIINENDTVATEEIRFGDNDELASLVSPLFEAQLLVVLSDVDGLLGDDGKRIRTVASVGDTEFGFIKGGDSEVGRGGMRSKLLAASRAARGGIPTVIASAETRSVVGKILAGRDIGTLFHASAVRMSSRKYWIGFALRPSGAILLDQGAAAAVRKKGCSILTVGVVGARGDFRAGDAVTISGPDGRVLGQGLARLSISETARAAGKAEGSALLVHRDDLAILDR